MSWAEVDWGQLTKGLIGQSDRQVLDRETDRYQGPGTSVKRTGVEKIMDTIFRGGSSAGIEKLSQEDYVSELKETYGSRLELLDPTVRKDLGITDRSGINKTMSEADIARQVKEGEILEEVRRRAKATRGIDPEDYAGTDPDVIEQNIAEARVQQGRVDTTSSPEWQRTEQRYIDALDRGNKQFAATMALNTGQMALANKRADNQMEIAQMQQQLQMRRQDSADRRADRRDRQAMIQQLMSGLSTLGASIAI